MTEPSGQGRRSANASEQSAGASAGPVLVGLVGRANAGKTSLLMHLTGTRQQPVNFPGSSVERTEAMSRDGSMRFVDLPGIASLSAHSPDEQVALDWLRTGSADVLCVVMDAAKLTVELQLLEGLRGLGVPVVVALNKVDVAERCGAAVDVAALERELGVPVVATDGFRGRGMGELRKALDAGGRAPRPFEGGPDGVARRVSAGGDVGPGRRRRSDQVDRILLHPLLGLPLLAVVMYAMFQLVFTVADPFIGWIEAAQESVSAVVAGWIEPGAMQSFVIDGLINGVGSVVVFLPQIALLVMFVAVLEASGYMARAVFLLDRVLRKVGLSGRSFVPLTTSFACAIPGIAASRIIDDERDRLATIAVAPLMSCSARLPVYVVLIGAFFPAAWAGFVLFCLYALGIVVAAVVAWILRRTALRGGSSSLMMELPAYQRPSVGLVLGRVWRACRAFAVTAGTVIFVATVAIWALSYYPRSEAVAAQFEGERAAVEVMAEGEARDAALAELEAREAAAQLEDSFLARIGKAIQPVFAPAGFDWRTTVGVLAAFPARELIVPTLGVLYSLGPVDAGDYGVEALEGPDPGGLRGRLRDATDAAGEKVMNPLVALSILVFFALCSQCVATLGAIRQETNSWRWPAFTFVYMTALAWLGAVAVYQVGHALAWGLA